MSALCRSATTDRLRSRADYASEAGSGSMPHAPAAPGFELVARLAPDDRMRLAELVGEDG